MDSPLSASRVFRDIARALCKAPLALGALSVVGALWPELGQRVLAGHPRAELPWQVLAQLCVFLPLSVYVLHGAFGDEELTARAFLSRYGKLLPLFLPVCALFLVPPLSEPVGPEDGGLFFCIAALVLILVCSVFYFVVRLLCVPYLLLVEPGCGLRSAFRTSLRFTRDSFRCATYPFGCLLFAVNVLSYLGKVALDGLGVTLIRIVFYPLFLCLGYVLFVHFRERAGVADSESVQCAS